MKLWIIVWTLMTAEGEPVRTYMGVVQDSRDCQRWGEYFNEAAIEAGGFGVYNCVQAPILSDDGLA